MEETIITDRAALAERLNEWQQTVAFAVDALKQRTDPELHPLLDAIESCHADSRKLTLVFQDAFLEQKESAERFITEMRERIADLRTTIPDQRRAT